MRWLRRTEVPLLPQEKGKLTTALKKIHYGKLHCKQFVSFPALEIIC